MKAVLLALAASCILSSTASAGFLCGGYSDTAAWFELRYEDMSD